MTKLCLNFTSVSVHDLNSFLSNGVIGFGLGNCLLLNSHQAIIRYYRANLCVIWHIFIKENASGKVYLHVRFWNALGEKELRVEVKIPFMLMIFVFNAIKWVDCTTVKTLVIVLIEDLDSPCLIFYKDNLYMHVTWTTTLYVCLLPPWLNSLRHSDAYASMNWVIIGSGNGLAPLWCQAITWTSADSLIGPSGNLNQSSEIFL